MDQTWCLFGDLAGQREPYKTEVVVIQAGSISRRPRNTPDIAVGYL